MVFIVMLNSVFPLEPRVLGIGLWEGPQAAPIGGNEQFHQWHTLVRMVVSYRTMHRCHGDGELQLSRARPLASIILRDGRMGVLDYYDERSLVAVVVFREQFSVEEVVAWHIESCEDEHDGLELKSPL